MRKKSRILNHRYMDKMIIIKVINNINDEIIKEMKKKLGRHIIYLLILGALFGFFVRARFGFFICTFFSFFLPFLPSFFLPIFSDQSRFLPGFFLYLFSGFFLSDFALFFFSNFALQLLSGFLAHVKANIGFISTFTNEKTKEACNDTCTRKNVWIQRALPAVPPRGPACLHLTV